MEQDSFEVIVEYILEHQKSFYRLAYSSVGNQQDAMDVVQNAICKALEHSEDLRDIHALKTWFYRILMNESVNFIKKNRREILRDEPIGEEAITREPEDTDAEELYQRIRELPLETQMMIRLRFYEELSLSEIAEVTGLNLNTVKAKLYRGLKMLRVKMEGTTL